MTGDSIVRCDPIVTIPETTRRWLWQLANDRNDVHDPRASKLQYAGKTAVQANFEGLVGEFAFAACYGIPFDEKIALDYGGHGRGDWDFVIGKTTIEVKYNPYTYGVLYFDGHRKPLTQDVGALVIPQFSITKPQPVAECGDETSSVVVVGWISRDAFNFLKTPRDFLKGKDVKAVEQNDLQPPDRLADYCMIDAGCAASSAADVVAARLR